MGTASRIGLCNKAISRIKAKEIQSLDEASLEARECRRHYPDVISEMLGGAHDWSFQNRRVALAANATNERSGEWLFAYAVPADLGTAIRLLPDLTSLGTGYPVPLPGEPYAETWALGGLYDSPYLIENGVIYSNIENATLEYGIDDIEEVVLTALVQRAIYTDLASRLASPVKGNEKLAETLSQEAEIWWQRAMAQDANQSPQSQGNFISETQAARAGYLTPLC
jgi:hypothetical protein